MKKCLLAMSMVLILGITVVSCATKGDLQNAQAREEQINLKADEALKASQEAKEAATNASEAVNKAEERARAAEERAAIAEARADKANAVFKGSMKK